MKDFKTNNFDLLRLFAAIEVLLLHAYVHLKIEYPLFFKVLANFPGVSMFFTISGFLISASFERNSQLSTFFKNRALRIFPGLWGCLFVTVATISITTNISFINTQSIPWFISQCLGIIYTPNFLESFGFGSYNGSLWTIPVELQFYIILPIIYLILRKIVEKERNKTIIFFCLLILFSLITFGIKVYYDKGDFDINNTPKIIKYTFVPNIYLFLFGVVMQRLKIYKFHLIFGKGIVWLILYLIVSYLLPSTNANYIFKLFFLSLTTISLAYTYPKLSNRILKGNDISYGVYIYHGLIIGIFAQFNLFGKQIYPLVILLLTIIMAILSWVLIEKPFLKRKSNTISHIAK